MGALFCLFALFVLFGLAYPACMALVWVAARLTGNKVKFFDFMKGV